jgi:hypothetical protein
MSELLAERLSRFTPDVSTLNRDELLFAAGRASAPPARRWQLCASGLALTQIAMLLLWLPGQGDPLGRPLANSERPPALRPSVSPIAGGHADPWSPRAFATEPIPAPAGALVPDEAPWHALSSPHIDLF